MNKFFCFLFLLGSSLSACVTVNTPITFVETPIPSQGSISQTVQPTEISPTATVTKSISTKTPVSASSPSSTPTPTIDCPDSSLENSEQGNSNISGNIYFWNKLPSYYATYDPERGSTSLRKVEPVSPDRPGPNQGFFSAFSQYSQEIAYLITNSHGFVELWISDLGLCKVEKIWEDKEQWLGDASKTQWDEQVWITWGPNDLSLILSSKVNRSHITV
jgi:hypothetical protein